MNLLADIIPIEKVYRMTDEEKRLRHTYERLMERLTMLEHQYDQWDSEMRAYRERAQ